MPYLIVNNVDLSDYVAYQGLGQEDETIVDEARDVTGTMVGDILTRKDKVLVSFRPLDAEEMKIFKAAIAPYFVTVRYLDNRTGNMKSINAYVGNHNEKIWTIRDDGTIIYSGFDCNFIER